MASYRRGRSRSSRNRNRPRRDDPYRKHINAGYKADTRSKKDSYRVSSSSSSESSVSSFRSSSRARSDTSSASPSSDSSAGKSRDDEIIHFDWHKGMSLGDSERYEVRRKLGDGTFGRVLECVDRTFQCRVAVKVIRDVKRYIDNAKVEARILEKINETRRRTNNHPGGRGIVRLFDIFTHANRFFCMSFERLGKTLFEVIQMNNYCGFYLWDIQQIARELLVTIDFIHSRCGLVHTDIKMENIMLCGTDFTTTAPPERTNRSLAYQRPVLVSEQSGGRHRSIRLIDFGNGVFEGDHHSVTINTRQYRSPEVILEQDWDEKSDMWSIGCVIGEMWTGELVFPTHSNLEHLAMIQRITDEQFDSYYFSYSPSDVRHRYATRDGLLNWPDGCCSRDSFKNVNECVPLRRMLRDEEALYHLVSRLLRIDPKRRYSAGQALDRCDFFTQKIDKGV